MINKKLLFLLLINVSFVFGYPNEPLRLSFVGDVMAHDVNFRIKDYSVIYADIKDVLLSDDCSFGNLETPVNEKEAYYSYPNFNIRRDYVEASIDAGLNVFSLANNHSFDRGYPGIVQTLCSFILLKEKKDMELYFSGIRADPGQSFNPISIEKKGWRIGFLAATQFINALAKIPYVNIVDYRNAEEANRFLDLVNRIARNYDLFIVSYHGDKEYSNVPEPLKVEFFKNLIKAGVNIVYGHHPHVMQPFQVVETAGKKGLIMYSMGNFISGQRWRSEPFDINNYRSYTGDSVILSVNVDFINNTPQITYKPVLITSYINQRQEIVIRKYENLLSESLDKKWMDYYKARYEIMKKMIAEYEVTLW